MTRDHGFRFEEVVDGDKLVGIRSSDLDEEHIDRLLDALNWAVRKVHGVEKSDVEVVVD